MKYNSCDDINQVLIDIHPKTGKLNDWQKHKKNNILLADACRRIQQYDDSFKGRAAKLENCANHLQFRRYEDGSKVLDRAYFCRYRQCDVCKWRRSLKIYGQTSQIMDVAESMGFRFLFVSFTIRNCQGQDLGRDITRIYQGLSKLLRTKKYKKAVQGWMRVLEVTHNVILGDKSFDTYHPHLHVILVVNKSYFKKNYIHHSELVQDWRIALKLDYDPNVDIRAIKENKTSDAIKEVSKYVTKPGDLLTWNDDLTDAGIWYLEKALAGRRLIAYGGILKTIKADLNLDDVESGDLVNVDCETEIRDDLKFMMEHYGWHPGYQQYFKNNDDKNVNTKKERF